MQHALSALILTALISLAACSAPQTSAQAPLDELADPYAGRDVILGDKQVKSVFVNVFGGITSCDAVASGIVKALQMLGSDANKPLVVRLDGNNVEVPTEMGEMMQNGLTYQLLVKTFNTRTSILRMAMQGAN